jgi:fucose 4-O-acetylase-like acetyltransferase
MDNTQLVAINNRQLNAQKLSQDLYLIRGLAIVFVVIGHVIGDRYSGIRKLYAEDIPNLGYAYNFIYTFHMPIFFIISGISFAIFSQNKTSFLKFLKSKATRLIIPLFCWAPIYFIFRFISAGNIKFSLVRLLTSPFYADFIFWFFHTLFLISIFCFLLIKKNSSQWVYLIVSIFLFVGSFYLSGLISLVLYWNIFYAFGYVAATYISQVRSKIENSSYFLSLVSIFLLILSMLAVNYFWNQDYSLIARFINGITGFSMMYIIAGTNWEIIRSSLIVKVIKVLSYIFTYLGKISMTIYLFHVMSGSLTRIILVKVGINHVFSHFSMGFAAAILIPIGLYEILKRNKFFLYSIGEFKGG